jgi:hypothetical protein
MQLLLQFPLSFYYLGCSFVYSSATDFSSLSFSLNNSTVFLTTWQTKLNLKCSRFHWVKNVCAGETSEFALPRAATRWSVANSSSRDFTSDSIVLLNSTGFFQPPSGPPTRCGFAADFPVWKRSGIPSPPNKSEQNETRRSQRRLSRRRCVNLNIESDSDMIDTSKRPPASTLTTVSVLSVTIAFLSRM